ncbi:Gfo/Idh/MocA family oxidoreductase [Humibacter antri]
MSDLLRVAVIGCGDVSSVHFDAIANDPLAELVAVCDTDAVRRTAASSRHGVPGLETHDELFERLHPDVVHIATPHDQHASIAIAALAAGVNVILEKPLAHTREAGDALVAAAEASGAKIGICFQNRYNLPVRAAKELIDSGRLGRVVGASATVVWHRTPEYYEDRPWRGTWAHGGGGLLMNQAIHTLDLLQWLAGDVERVTGGAATRTLGGTIEVEDTADLVLEHAGGARSTFYATLSNVVNQPVTVDVIAENGALSLRGDLVATFADGAVETVREERTATGERAYWGSSHALLIHDFYESLSRPEPFWISPREARKTLRIIQSVYDQAYPGRSSAPVARG